MQEFKQATTYHEQVVEVGGGCKHGISLHVDSPHSPRNIIKRRANFCRSCGAEEMLWFRVMDGRTSVPADFYSLFLFPCTRAPPRGRAGATFEIVIFKFRIP
jgi:hypothetical protein